MIKFTVKFLVTAGLLWWVLSKTDLSSVGAAFSQCRPGWLILAFLLHFVGLFITVVRWEILFHPFGSKIPLRRLTQSFMVGQFFNSFLPSTVGGDISRSVDFRKEVGGARSFAIVFVERFSGLMAMVLMAAIALPFAKEVIPEGYYLKEIVLGILALFIVFVAVILLPQTSRLLGKESKLARFHEALVTYSRYPKELYAALALGFLLQVNVVIYYYFLCLGLGLDYSILYLFIIIPILKVVLLFPFVINGIGLRENAFAYFLKAKGSSIGAALALSWLDLGMVLAFALIGGVVYVVRKQAPAHA